MQLKSIDFHSGDIFDWQIGPASIHKLVYYNFSCNQSSESS